MRWKNQALHKLRSKLHRGSTAAVGVDEELERLKAQTQSMEDDVRAVSVEIPVLCREMLAYSERLYKTMRPMTRWFAPETAHGAAARLLSDGTRAMAAVVAHMERSLRQANIVLRRALNDIAKRRTHVLDRSLDSLVGLSEAVTLARIEDDKRELRQLLDDASRVMLGPVVDSVARMQVYQAVSVRRAFMGPLAEHVQLAGLEPIPTNPFKQSASTAERLELGAIELPSDVSAWTSPPAVESIVPDVLDWRELRRTRGVSSVSVASTGLCTSCDDADDANANSSDSESYSFAACDEVPCPPSPRPLPVPPVLRPALAPRPNASNPFASLADGAGAPTAANPPPPPPQAPL